MLEVVVDAGKQKSMIWIMKKTSKRTSRIITGGGVGGGGGARRITYIWDKTYYYLIE